MTGVEPLLGVAILEKGSGEGVVVLGERLLGRVRQPVPEELKGPKDLLPGIPVPRATFGVFGGELV
jgi:hypothetical protein